MSQLEDLALAIERNVGRFGSLYVRPAGLIAAVIIEHSDDGANGDHVVIDASTPYAVAEVGEEVTLNGRDESLTLPIVTKEFTADGKVKLFFNIEITSDATPGNPDEAGGAFVIVPGESSITSPYRQIGNLSGTEFSWTPQVSEADTSGRTVTYSIDTELTTNLLATSDAVLGTLPGLTSVLYDAVLLGKKQTLASLEKESEFDTEKVKRGIVLRDVLIQPSGTINFMGEGSSIALTIPKRIVLEDVPTITSL